MSDMVLPARRAAVRAAGAGHVASDERLAMLVARGHGQAFAALYRRHHQALYRYCRVIVRNEQDAEDALQSAMMRALAALRKEERDIAVRPWLFRIAHNEAVSILRRRAARPLTAGGVEPPELQATALDVEGTIAQRERLATLVADIQALGERQRAALVMRELSGLSMNEIGSALSTSPGAAKQLLFEARSAMHELAEGRKLGCEAVRRALSDGDRRVWRGRRISAHLRACAGCRELQRAIAARGSDLRALAPPLPAVAASGLLVRVLSGASSSSHGGGAASSGAAIGAGATGVGSGAHAGMGVVAKMLAAAVLAAGAGVGAAHLATSAQREGRRSPHASVPSGARRSLPGYAAPARSPASAGGGATRAAGRGARGRRAVERPTPGPSGAGGVSTRTAPGASVGMGHALAVPRTSAALFVKRASGGRVGGETRGRGRADPPQVARGRRERSPHGASRHHGTTPPARSRAQSGRAPARAPAQPPAAGRAGPPAAQHARSEAPPAQPASRHEREASGAGRGE